MRTLGLELSGICVARCRYETRRQGSLEMWTCRDDLPHESRVPGDAQDSQHIMNRQGDWCDSVR